MRARLLLSVFSFLLSTFYFAGCGYNPIATKPGASIAAGNADRVIQAQAVNLADKIDNPSKPFLHSVATALRENSGDIVNPADVQRLVTNYGDPDNKQKFKQLGADLWTLFKNASAQYGKVKGAEILATALNTAGEKK